MPKANKIRLARNSANEKTEIFSCYADLNFNRTSIAPNGYVLSLPIAATCFLGFPAR